MKVLNYALSFAVVALLAIGCSKLDPAADNHSGNDSDLKSATLTGNGAPSGAHYNLNIIGVPRGKTADMTNNNGGRIFVPLTNKPTRINLSPGVDFQVTDANGTDGTAAFTLPADVSTSYTVYARALGKPGGSATITTCGELIEEGAILAKVCSDAPITLTRTSRGAPKFTDVSKNLLFIIIPADVVATDGTVIAAGTYSLFDEALQTYFWEYDNNGLKLLQLRFYPI